MIKTNKLFLAKSTLAYHTEFLVSAIDIIQASSNAVAIVRSVNKDALLISIDTFRIDLIDFIPEDLEEKK